MTANLADRQMVLLVDDEPRVLRGLKRLLRDDRWDLRATTDVDAALEFVGSHPVDVVVSDYRMPRMDGVTLLEHVRDRRPETVRVVLSGEIDAAHLDRSTTVAHQWLTKPCEPAILIAALDRCRQLRDMLRCEELRRLIGRLGTLPSSPALWTELQRCLSDDDVSADEVAAVVGADIALTTKVLQLVNSAFMGLSRQVTSVSEAVAYIGLNTLRNLVVSVEVFRSFPLPERLDDFCIDTVTAHGQASSQLVLGQLRDRTWRDHAAAAALLQDVGQLIHASCDPDAFATWYGEAIRSRRSLHEVEHDGDGFTHATIGAYLLMLWGLPRAVVDAVAAHHRPLDGPPRDEPNAIEAVRAAHLVVQRYSRRAADPSDRTDDDEIDRELGRILTPTALARWRRHVEAADERAGR